MLVYVFFSNLGFVKIFVRILKYIELNPFSSSSTSMSPSGEDNDDPSRRGARPLQLPREEEDHTADDDGKDKDKADPDGGRFAHS